MHLIDWDASSGGLVPGPIDYSSPLLLNSSIEPGNLRSDEGIPPTPDLFLGPQQPYRVQVQQDQQCIVRIMTLMPP
jgi:hypothetical protein